MAKKRLATSTSRRKVSARQGSRRTLAELNAWMTAHHDKLLGAAARNCMKLTGKQSFGAGNRRKSA